VAIAVMRIAPSSERTSKTAFVAEQNGTMGTLHSQYFKKIVPLFDTDNKLTVFQLAGGLRPP
jgi:hypothetical protein